LRSRRSSSSSANGGATYTLGAGGGWQEKIRNE
jgi:hypothetical protein